MQTINELEVSFQASLEALRNAVLTRDAALAKEILLPDGLTPVVELVHESGRRKRGDAAAWNWNPQTDKIVISYRPISAANGLISAMPAKAQEAERQPATSVARAPQAMSASFEKDENISDHVTPQEIIECCRALASAEKSNRQFIALKWFRDDFLPTVDYLWARSPQRRQRVLAHAIEMGRIDTKKTHNPKAPQFPTTTISLNRSIPTPGVPPRFQPVAIRGEAASTTLLRDRGSI